MLDRALEAGVPFAWVAGDSVYGADHRIRRRLEARGRGYVLAVTSGQQLGFVPVEKWLAKVPPDGRRRLSAGEGAKGPRLYDRAYLPYRGRSEEHTSELQSRQYLVCRLLLEKKKT